MLLRQISSELFIFQQDSNPSTQGTWGNQTFYRQHYAQRKSAGI